VRPQILSVLAACVLAGAVGGQTRPTGAPEPNGVTPITWADTAPLHGQLQAAGLTAASFASHVNRLREAHATRVRLGDLDHLVFYLLQSSGFTPLPPIEPALSAKALVDALGAPEREAFLRGRDGDARISAAVRARTSALLTALDQPRLDPRLLYFSELVKTTFPDAKTRDSGLDREYLRVMRFVYEKEFVAQRSPRPGDAVADLYRTRGLSTDTAVEAGFLVSFGVGILKALDPERRVRRGLIIGPGLDLAPRTGLLEAGPPESYQPWAVMDALVSQGLARFNDLKVVGADINPRVVSHLRRAHDTPPVLSLMTEIRDSETVALSPEYREYFAGLGRAIATVGAPPAARSPLNGHLRRTVRVGPAAAAALDARALDIVTERLDLSGEALFDLVIATNILPYFDDGELMLALTNIAAMLAPGGVFLHNEARPSMSGITAALGLPFEQSRHVVIATVRGAPAPLFDSVFLHRKVNSERQ